MIERVSDATKEKEYSVGEEQVFFFFLEFLSFLQLCTMYTCT